MEREFQLEKQSRLLTNSHRSINVKIFIQSSLLKLNHVFTQIGKRHEIVPQRGTISNPCFINLFTYIISVE